MKMFGAVLAVAMLMSGCSLLGVKGVKTDDVLSLVSQGAACADQVNAVASVVKDQVPACVELSKTVKDKLD